MTTPDYSRNSLEILKVSQNTGSERERSSALPVGPGGSQQEAMQIRGRHERPQTCTGEAGFLTILSRKAELNAQAGLGSPDASLPGLETMCCSPRALSCAGAHVPIRTPVR